MVPCFGSFLSYTCAHLRSAELRWQVGGGWLFRRIRPKVDFLQFAVMVHLPRWALQDDAPDIEHQDAVASVDQAVHEVRPDEPGPAGDEEIVHELSFLL